MEVGQSSGRKGSGREKKRKKKGRGKRERKVFRFSKPEYIYLSRIFETSFRFDVFFTIISILNEYGTKSNFQAIIEY